MKILPARAESFIKNIKVSPMKGILLYGEEGVLSYRSNYIKKSFENFEFIKIDLGAEQSISDVFAESYGLSLFSASKLINVSGENEARFSGIDYLINKIDSTFPNFLLLQAPFSLDANSKFRKLCENSPLLACIACYSDEKDTMTALILDFLKDNNLTMEPSTLNYLAENFSGNRNSLFSELEKIKIYKKEGKISLLEVKAIIEEDGETNILDSINNFFYLNPVSFLKEVEKLKNVGIPSSALCSAIINQCFKYIEYLQESQDQNKSVENTLREKFVFFKQIPTITSHLNKWNLGKINLLLFHLRDKEIEIRQNLEKGYEILVNSFAEFYNI